MAMKKFILTLLFLLAFFTLNTITDSNAESNNEDGVVDYNIQLLTEKIAKLEKEIYLNNLIQNIEFESEVIIPDYLDIKYVEYIYNIADTLDIPARIAFRLVYKESRFNDTITSRVGAYGLMQLMPGTKSMYQNLLRTDTLNLDKNQEDIYIGLNYLKDFYVFWRENGNSEIISWKLSLASYNAGKGNVLKYKGIPPYKETQDFVAFIIRSHSNPEFLANYSKKYDNSHKGNS
jgi:soluble lytic murein transglycosylase-like protein